jgi:hypothetical protein
MSGKIERYSAACVEGFSWNFACTASQLKKSLSERSIDPLESKR